MACARRVLGKNKIIAFTAISETYSARERQRAQEMAAILDVEHREIHTCELDNSEFAANPENRCYFCKQELYSKLSLLARESQMEWIADGTNLSDLSDNRPGRDAAREIGVRSPLLESGIGKDEVRELSRRMSLPTWDLPPMACLASRVPYGSALTAEKLMTIEQAEELMFSLGLRNFRVRHHGSMARLELGEEDMEAVHRDPCLRLSIVEKLKECGYTYITLDLEGYRTGSMNAVLGSPDFK